MKSVLALIVLIVIIIIMTIKSITLMVAFEGDLVSPLQI